MCTVLLLPGVNPTALKYIVSYYIISYHIIYRIISYHIVSYIISTSGAKNYTRVFALNPLLSSWVMLEVSKAQWLLLILPVLTLRTSTFCPHTVFMCFVWIPEQAAIISLYSINWLVFITEKGVVYCAVRTGCLNMIQVNFVFNPFKAYRSRDAPPV